MLHKSAYLMANSIDPDLDRLICIFDALFIK